MFRLWVLYKLSMRLFAVRRVREAVFLHMERDSPVCHWSFSVGVGDKLRPGVATLLVMYEIFRLNVLISSPPR